MKRLTYYLKLWWLTSLNSFRSILVRRSGLVIFSIGKILRFTLFFIFIFLLLSETKTLAGYSLNQVIFFYLTFNLIDTLSQFLFREAYRFRPLVVSGNFDLVLTKPYNALFRVLAGGADIIDLLTLPFFVAGIAWVGGKLGPGGINYFFYFLLVINGLIIAASFHILVLGLGIITFEIDHTIMIYRDLSSLGRFPVDIYREPLKGILTFLVPLGVMFTFPAKALMGLISPWGIIWSLGFGAIFFYLSLRFWNLALKKYSSSGS